MKILDQPLALRRFTSWPPFFFLLIVAFTCLFTISAGIQEIDKIRSAYHMSAEAALTERTWGFLPLIRAVQERVPRDESILMTGETGEFNRGRVINYWLYPRKIYSTTVLESTGEDVEEFVKRRAVPWRYENGDLTRQDLEVPPSAPEELPCSLDTSSVLRVAAGTSLALAHFLAVGACLLGALGVLRVLRRWPERLAASFLLGSAAVGGWTLASFALGFGVSLWTVCPSLIVALLAFCAHLWRDNRGSGGERLLQSSGPPPETKNTNRVAMTLVGILLALLAVRAVALPMGGYDDRFQWAYKAHIMLHEDSLWGAGFQDPQTLHFHPKYPLLIPSIEAVVFLYAGGFNDQYVTVLFPLFTAALAVMLYFGLGALGRARWAGIVVLARILLPFYWGYDIVRDGAAAFAGYSDVPLAAFSTAAMICLLRGWRQAAPCLYGLAGCLVVAAALTKAEGKIHAVVFFASAFGLLVWGGRRAGLRYALVCFGIAGAAIALHEYFIVFRTQVGILPDDYGTLFGWDQLVSSIPRIPALAKQLIKDLIVSPRFGYFGIVLVAAVALHRERARESEALVPLLFTLAMLALFCAPYMLLPEDEWGKIYFYSAARLISQVVPIGFLATALIVLPSDSASQGMSTPTGDLAGAEEVR